MNILNRLISNNIEFLKIENLIPYILGSDTEPDHDLMIFDTSLFEENYKNFIKTFDWLEVFVATKGLTPYIENLSDLDSKFEIATDGELSLLKKYNIKNKNIIFTHPDKTVYEIANAYRYGITTFVTEEFKDIENIAKYAPQSQILVRIKSPCTKGGVYCNSTHSLNERFSVKKDKALQLIEYAKNLNLIPIGLAFHPGWQLVNPSMWEEPIELCSEIFHLSAKLGIELNTLDICGGIPTLNDERSLELFGTKNYYEVYSNRIRAYIQTYFKECIPRRIISEPATAIGGNCAIIIGHVISVSGSENLNIKVSTGRFSAGIFQVRDVVEQFHFFEVIDGERLRKRTERKVLASVYGKVCSSEDTLDEMEVPESVSPGDIFISEYCGVYCIDLFTKWCSKNNPDIIKIKSYNEKIYSIVGSDDSLEKICSK